MPEEEHACEFLYQQLSLKMHESWANLNREEVLFAFRSNKTVKDWGKSVNLLLVDEVVAPYMEMRAEVSKIEESLKTRPLQIEDKEQKKELSEQDWLQWLPDIKGYKLELIPVGAYDFLLRTGRINPTTDEKKEYMRRATNYRIGELEQGTMEYAIFLTMKHLSKFEGEQKERLVTISKKMIVQDFLNRP